MNDLRSIDYDKRWDTLRGLVAGDPGEAPLCVGNLALETKTPWVWVVSPAHKACTLLDGSGFEAICAMGALAEAFELGPVASYDQTKNEILRLTGKA